MDELHRSDFQPVLRTLQQSFAGDRGVGRAFWQLGLLEKVMAHTLTPDRLKEACDLVRSYELAVDYVMQASDLHEAWSRSLEVLTATNDLLAWAAELNLIVSRPAKSEF